MKQILIAFFIGLINLGYSQNFPELEKVLAKEFPENSFVDGRWMFYADEATIEKIDMPYLKTLIPQFDFYRVSLTNLLGYHVNHANCVVLFNNSTSELILVEPIWYDEVSSKLIKIFLNKKFDNQEDLKTCLRKLHKLMALDSTYQFIETSFTNSLLTYDLVYFKKESNTLKENDIVAPVNYTNDNVWRKIEVEIKQLKIKSYKTFNLKLKDEKGYKRTIY